MKKNCTLFLLLFITMAAFAQPTIRWQKSYGGSNHDVANSIKQTSDGGYIVAGYSYSSNGDVTINRGKADFWVAKLDAAGTITWQKTYGGSQWDVAKCIQPTSDGGYIVVGYTNSYDGDVLGRVKAAGDAFNYYDGWVIRLNSTGGIVFRTCLYAATYSVNPSENAAASTVIQATDGSFVVGGMRQINGQDPADIADFQIAKTYSWTLKLSNLGYVSWQSKLPIDGEASQASLQDSNGVRSIVQVGNNFTVLSSGARYTGGLPVCVTAALSHNDVSLLHLNGFTGGSLWEKRFSGNELPSSPSQFTAAADLQKTIDGGYVIAGNTEATTGCFSGAGNHGDEDFFVLKTTSTGVFQWARCFGGSNRDIATSVFQAADGTYYVGGYSYSSDGQVTDHNTAAPVTADYWVVKLNIFGTLLWSKSYGGTGNDIGMAMAKTTNGRYVIAGSSTSSYSTILNKGSTDWLVINFDDCNLPPPSSYSPQIFTPCSSPKISSLVASGTNIKWYLGSNSPTPLPLTMPLPAGYSIYWVSQTSATGCVSPKLTVTAQVTAACRMAMTNGANQNNISADEAFVYPNPNSGSFQLNMPVDTRLQQATIQLADVYAKIVLSKTCVVTNGFIREKIALRNLAAGMYFLRIHETGKSNSIKVIINQQ